MITQIDNVSLSQLLIFFIGHQNISYIHIYLGESAECLALLQKLSGTLIISYPQVLLYCVLCFSKSLIFLFTLKVLV